MAIITAAGKVMGKQVALLAAAAARNAAVAAAGHGRPPTSVEENEKQIEGAISGSDDEDIDGDSERDSDDDGDDVIDPDENSVLRIRFAADSSIDANCGDFGQKGLGSKTTIQAYDQILSALVGLQTRAC